MSALNDAIYNFADAFGYPQGTYYLSDGAGSIVPDDADSPMSLVYRQQRMVYLHDGAGTVTLAVLDQSGDIEYENLTDIADLNLPVQTYIRNQTLYVSGASLSGLAVLEGKTIGEVIRKAQQLINTRQIGALMVRGIEPSGTSVQTIDADKVFLVDPRTGHLHLTGPQTLDFFEDIDALDTNEHRLALITYDMPHDELARQLGTIQTRDGGVPYPGDFLPADFEAFSVPSGHVPMAFVYLYAGQTVISEDELMRAYDPRTIYTVSIKNNLGASAAPDVTDDSTQGFGIGSLWTHGSGVYLCTDPSVGAAQWEVLGAGAGGDFYASGSVPMTGDLQMAGNAILDAAGVLVHEVSTPSTPDTGKGAFYFGTDSKPRAINDVGGVFDLTAGGGVNMAIFYFGGEFDTGTSPMRIYNVTGETKIIARVWITVATAPTGVDLIVDVNKNGTTIFTDQAHRPRVTPGNLTGDSTDIDDEEWEAGDLLTVDVDQADGLDLTVHIVYS